MNVRLGPRLFPHLSPPDSRFVRVEGMLKVAKQPVGEATQGVNVAAYEEPPPHGVAVDPAA